MFRLRHPEAADHATLTALCIRTGDAGDDAGPRYTDPQLLADIFMRPYLELEPGWCWVAEGDEGIVGYLVATPDTLAFAGRAEAQCWPALRRRHPLPDPGNESDQAQLVRRLHAGAPIHMPFIDAYPAHLHVDLLPQARGCGLGRQLMDTLLAALQAASVRGVHLGVAARNTRAIAFYEHLGFEVLEQADWGRWMGRRLRA